jgi:RNA polymerase sigma factor (sigma-70 family)
MDKEQLFKEAVEANKDRIFRICCWHVFDAEERKDIYQKTLIHIWEGLRTFREGAAVSSWVYRITVNTCLDHVRSEARRRRILGTRIAEDSGQGLDAVPARAPAAENGASRDLYAAIDRLSPADKTVVSLYLEDLGGAEIATVMGISEGAVRIRVHRIKNLLRSMINEANHGNR